MQDKKFIEHKGVNKIIKHDGIDDVISTKGSKKKALALAKAKK